MQQQQRTTVPRITAITAPRFPSGSGAVGGGGANGGYGGLGGAGGEKGGSGGEGGGEGGGGGGGGGWCTCGVCGWWKCGLWKWGLWPCGLWPCGLWRCPPPAPCSRLARLIGNPACLFHVCFPVVMFTFTFIRPLGRRTPNGPVETRRGRRRLPAVMLAVKAHTLFFPRRKALISVTF